VNVADIHDRFDLPTVISDNLAIGRMAAEHLIARGYRHLGVFMLDPMWYASRRCEGFEKTAHEAGRKVGVFRAAVGSAWHGALKSWLQAGPRPMAVFAANDVLACEVVNAALRLGMRIPEDIAVLGVDDDVSLCETSTVPISSVAVDAERIGYEAAALLDRLMEGELPPAEPIEIPPLRVVARESTDFTAVGNSTVARALRLMADADDETFTISKLAETLGVSRRTLEQRFRQALGRGPAQELRRQRIERAKLLLQETNRKVIDVALRSGFAGASQFSVAFRQATGMSPRDYRRQVQTSDRET
jgi:LacI family transcriptional regulator